jgi:hypothetical protein
VPFEREAPFTDERHYEAHDVGVLAHRSHLVGDLTRGDSRVMCDSAGDPSEGS